MTADPMTADPMTAAPAGEDLTVFGRI